jgi:hypothetical protein
LVFERTVPTASYISSCEEDFTVSIFTPEIVCTFSAFGSSFLAHPKKRKGRTQKTEIRILFILNLNEFGTQICADKRRLKMELGLRKWTNATIKPKLNFFPPSGSHRILSPVFFYPEIGVYPRSSASHKNYEANG